MTTTWEASLAYARPRTTIQMSRDENPWIDAFNDPKADLQTFSTCIALSDLHADDDHKFVLADFGNGIQVKLKVYKGTSLSAELPLLTQPCAVKCVYTDRNEPRVGGIIVASGANVLVYRNCRPYFKFTLPPQECSGLEAEVWNDISSADQLVQILKDLSLEIGFSNLSSPSQNLMLMAPSLRDEYISSRTHFVAKKEMVITCMATLNKYAGSEQDVSVIILATECSQLFVMDPETFTLINEFKLPDVCCNLCASGIYLVEYCIVLAMRNGALHSLKMSQLRFITHLTSHAVSLTIIANKVFTANMDSTLNCFNMKGRKYWAIRLPDNPLHMMATPLPNLALTLIAVNLARGNINLYNDSHLVYVITTQEPIHSMVFGRYGQEEHALLSIAASGTLDIKLLKRTAQFYNDYKFGTQNYVKPHEIKFLVPKKSKLFLEQSLRERQNCKDIHTWFNYTWTSMKLQVSESYIDALHNANVTQNDALRIIVEVFGLGPRMKIRTVLQNMSQSAIPMNYKVTFVYDARLYKIHQPVIKVPLMVNGIAYSLETLVTCQAQVAGVVQVLVVSNKVILTATVNMPDSAGILE
ncbi:bardet-Biedl syndrome 1 [Nesidiocoris tenuis]|uniref:Bardet-Biedl syndrome 1 n=1 Tax=Nesidiocoris tenuis TaxID=355587 RepID=A0ABN7ADG2_9HEMI|nr:bardet-Biedl syndrome 1 [Nesidiocoris tenuis]